MILKAVGSLKRPMRTVSLVVQHKQKRMHDSSLNWQREISHEKLQNQWDDKDKINVTKKM